MESAGRTTGVAGLVLAAGRSSRMGEPKPLLELDGRSFLRATIEALREGGCDGVTAVVASPAAASEARAAGARTARGRPDGEQIDSLRSGLDALGPDVDAVAVLPVDHPRVRPATVRALVAAWRSDREALVRPVHEGRPGHPTVFPRRFWPALRDPSLEEGARSVVESERVVDVPVDDPGVLVDIDTPEAYERHAGPGPGGLD